VVVVVPAAGELPLAPIPPGGDGSALLVALRPELPVAAARALLPALRELAAHALAAGGRLYLMSVEPETPGFLEAQFGDALPRLRELKDALDPHRLLNRWRL
jgi:FAD/FMN-containing dehydrogenase